MLPIPDAHRNFWARRDPLELFKPVPSKLKLPMLYKWCTFNSTLHASHHHMKPQPHPPRDLPMPVPTLSFLWHCMSRQSWKGSDYAPTPLLSTCNSFLEGFSPHTAIQEIVPSALGFMPCQLH